MADQPRRIGCGCLPIVLAVFVASSLLGWVREGVPGGAGAIVVSLLGVAIATAVVWAIFRAARRRFSRDNTGSGEMPDGPAGTVPSRPPPVATTPQPTAAERTRREVRSGTRQLSTQPDTEESRVLRDNLVEAVSDLADKVEEMPEAGTPTAWLSSEEMIQRAKERIRNYDDG